ncbi:hypothetical protein ACHAW5_008813 [Stephanodiscus triporus]|uniref:Uncharacterized protein n=1 Tax=Stephanodiscus triporus TaxID=2934178 RepID=A0ABD3QST8_9STRA
MFDYHVKWFVDMLPPSWQGTLFLVSLPEYEQYLKDVDGMLNALGDDPRVRWIDGHVKRARNTWPDRSISTDIVPIPNTGINGEAMTVCSNVTEMMGQLLLGHTLGPKADFMERVGQAPSKIDTFTWCHACPKCLLPFKIVPYPRMKCVRGPFLPKEESHSCPKQYQIIQSYQNSDPLLCPSSCLEQEVTSEARSESDIIFVRQCPIP